MTITVKRGPEGSNYWSGDGTNGRIIHQDNYLEVRGSIAYGQGSSDVGFQIHTDSFDELAAAMMAADKVSAAKAFGWALGNGWD
jgi:hypothetical protein